MNEHDMVEDTEQEEVSELDYPPEGELSSLMLMGFPSDRIYMVYDCGEVYYFRYLGNETFGIDTELLLAQTPDADHIEVAKKTSCIANRTSPAVGCHASSAHRHSWKTVVPSTLHMKERYSGLLCWKSQRNSR